MVKSTREALRIVFYLLLVISTVFTIDYDSLIIGRVAHVLVFSILLVLCIDRIVDIKVTNLEISYWRILVIVAVFIKIIWQTYHESPSGLLPPNLDPSLSIVYYVILMIMVSFLIGFHSPSSRSLRECGNEQSRDSAQSEDRSNK